MSEIPSRRYDSVSWAETVWLSCQMCKTWQGCIFTQFEEPHRGVLSCARRTRSSYQFSITKMKISQFTTNICNYFKIVQLYSQVLPGISSESSVTLICINCLLYAVWLLTVVKYCCSLISIRHNTNLHYSFLINLVTQHQDVSLHRASILYHLYLQRDWASRAYCTTQQIIVT